MNYNQDLNPNKIDDDLKDLQDTSSNQDNKNKNFIFTVLFSVLVVFILIAIYFIQKENAPGHKDISVESSNILNKQNETVEDNTKPNGEIGKENDFKKINNSEWPLPIEKGDVDVITNMKKAEIAWRKLDGDVDIFKIIKSCDNYENDFEEIAEIKHEPSQDVYFFIYNEHEYACVYNIIQVDSQKNEINYTERKRAEKKKIWDQAPVNDSDIKISLITIDRMLTLPAEVHAFDSSGRHTGIIKIKDGDEEFAYLEESLPNSKANTGPSGKYQYSLLLPDEYDDLILEIRGTGSSGALLVLGERNWGEYIQERFFSLDLKDGSLHRIKFSSINDISDLYKDEDGSGLFNKTINEIKFVRLEIPDTPVYGPATDELKVEEIKEHPIGEISSDLVIRLLDDDFEGNFKFKINDNNIKLIKTNKVDYFLGSQLYLEGLCEINGHNNIPCVFYILVSDKSDNFSQAKVIFSIEDEFINQDIAGIKDFIRRSFYMEGDFDLVYE